MPRRVQTVLANFTSIYEKADIEKKKVLLKSIIENITITEWKSSKDRKIDKINLFFDLKKSIPLKQKIIL